MSILGSLHEVSLENDSSVVVNSADSIVKAFTDLSFVLFNIASLRIGDDAFAPKCAEVKISLVNCAVFVGVFSLPVHLGIFHRALILVSVCEGDLA